MKILSVITSPLGVGGWRIQNIARLLQLRGHEVHLAQYVRKADLERFEKSQFDAGSISTSIITVSRLTVHAKHLREVTRGNYDLVYGNTHLGAFYSLLGRLKRTPLVFDMHGGLTEEFLLYNQRNLCWKHPTVLFLYLLDKIIDFVDLRFSNKIVCVSNKMLHYLHEEKGVPFEKMAYVTNGVDLEFFKPAYNRGSQVLRGRLGLEGKFVFGYVGGFQIWQGVENFIKAAKVIDDPGITFIIVGGDKKSKEGNILFIPEMPRSQITDYYSICDVLVLPRSSYPATEMAAPTKFAEYAAMGKPVLTTNVGDAADFVRKYNCGIVVENNTVGSLIEGILQFSNKPKDELERMGRNSRRLAESEFDWDKVACNLFNVVEGLANNI